MFVTLTRKRSYRKERKVEARVLRAWLLPGKVAM